MLPIRYTGNTIRNKGREQQITRFYDLIDPARPISFDKDVPEAALDGEGDEAPVHTLAARAEDLDDPPYAVDSRALPSLDVPHLIGIISRGAALAREVG